MLKHHKKTPGAFRYTLSRAGNQICKIPDGWVQDCSTYVAMGRNNSNLSGNLLPQILVLNIIF